MNERIYDRPVRFDRIAVFEDFRLIGQALVSSLGALHRINFDAPWRHEPKEPGAC